MNKKKDLTKQSSMKEMPISNFEAYWNSQFLDASFEDWLKYLRSRNDKANLPVESATNSEISWSLLDCSTPTDCDIVFKWCQQLKQPTGVSHRTIEIYERFTLAYYIQKFSSKKEAKNSKVVKSTKHHWQEIYTEMRHQSLLHLVSCLQIASKLENGYKVVTVSEAAMLLRTAHRPCDLSTILNSEVLVLVTLRHDVNYPPVTDYVETFICQLIMVLKKKPVSQRNRQLLSVIDEIHKVSMLFIRAIYFDQQTIIQRIVAAVNSQTVQVETNSKEYHQQRRKIKCDKVLLAAGAISAATYFVQPSAAAQVMKELHTRTGAHPSDIAVVSSVLIIYVDPEKG